MNLVVASTHWAAIITSVAAALAAIGVFFIILQISESRRSRDAQLAIELSRRWSDPSFVNSRAATALKDGTALMEKVKTLYESEDRTDYYKIIVEADLFEDLAVLVRHRCLDEGIVWDTLGLAICDRWERWKETAHYLSNLSSGADNGDDEVYAQFKWLAERMNYLDGYAKSTGWAASSSQLPPPSFHRFQQFSDWLTRLNPLPSPRRHH